MDKYGELIMHLVSINIGLPRNITYGGKVVYTDGTKGLVTEAMLRTTNFDGDGQADLNLHGGPDRAVCVYSFDHYTFWEEWSGTKLAPGAFSENLTISGVRETDICIGDTFKCGEALVQVSQPRLPCTKLAGKHGRQDLPDAIRAKLYTGFYLRVLEGGSVRVGDLFEKITAGPLAVSVLFAAQVMLKQRSDLQDLQRVLAVSELSQGWRETLSKRI